jgi:hypothetical protein
MLIWYHDRRGHGPGMQPGWLGPPGGYGKFLAAYSLATTPLQKTGEALAKFFQQKREHHGQKRNLAMVEDENKRILEEGTERFQRAGKGHTALASHDASHQDQPKTKGLQDQESFKTNVEQDQRQRATLRINTNVIEANEDDESNKALTKQGATTIANNSNQHHALRSSFW